MKRLVALGVVATLFAACGTDDAKPTPPPVEAGADSSGPVEPNFTNVFTYVLKGCLDTQCHGAAHAGDLLMAGRSTAYQNLVGVLANGPCAPDAGSDGGGDGAVEGGPVEAGAAVEAGATSDAGPKKDGGTNLGATTAPCGCASSGQTRVIPGNPEESLLMQKLTVTQTCGDRMPPTGEPVDDFSVELVRQWIADGAQKDF